MKARRKGIVNDEWKDVICVQLEGSNILYREQYLEFQYDNLSTELKNYGQVDEENRWQDVRERAAIAAMQAILSNFNGKLSQIVYENAAKYAISFADALVKQLKGE